MRKDIAKKLHHLLLGDRSSFIEIRVKLDPYIELQNYLNSNFSKKSNRSIFDNTLLELYRSSIVILASETSANFELIKATESTYTFIYRNFVRKSVDDDLTTIDSEAVSIIKYVETQPFCSYRTNLDTPDQGVWYICLIVLLLL